MVIPVHFHPIDGISTPTIRHNVSGVVVNLLDEAAHLLQAECMNVDTVQPASGVARRPKVKVVRFLQMAGMNTDNNNGWQQSYVAYFHKKGVVPMDVNAVPDPSVWKKVNKPKRGVTDWIDYIVDGKTMRRLSLSTKTYYDTEMEPYRPSPLAEI